MQDNNGLDQNGAAVLTLEGLGALQEMVDALEAKVDSLDTRIGKVEALLEEIVAEQD